MKILVFGATGATGHHLLLQALKLRHSVTAFVRDPSKFKIDSDRIKIHRGDAGDYQSVEDAIKGQDAVLSALGASNPFTRNLTLIKGVQNIVTAMTKQEIKRFIYQSFLGVTENRKELGFLFHTILPQVLRNLVLDHEAKEGIVISSALDWTVVRCAVLTNGAFTGNYKEGEHVISTSLFPTVSRADVAHFMLRQLTEKKYLHKKPRIMY
jgi:putative NADH-flavin reductase